MSKELTYFIHLGSDKNKTTKAKEIDIEYRTTLVVFGKYKFIMFAMAELMEMKTTEQNKVVLQLFNNIN